MIYSNLFCNLGRNAREELVNLVNLVEDIHERLLGTLVLRKLRENEANVSEGCYRILEKARQRLW